VRLLRSHALTSTTWDRHRGHDPAYDIVDIGFNFRLDEPRAALGLSRLRRLPDCLQARRATVRAYRERLAGLDGLELCFDEQAVERSSHFAFPVLLPDRERRDEFRDRLKEAGVQTTWYPALHCFTEYASFAPADGLPAASEVAGRHCALPLSSATTIDDVEVVVEAARGALAGQPV
jgi:dTDP-4-amino-4,6-dideoxygalactose transaminase